ncbi:MAG: tyrosine-type recombinase/integrase [Euzebya sp.]
MAGNARRHSGGSIRLRKSGRWQVRVHDEATGKHVSIGTFATKADANAALRRAGSEKDRGGWVSPQRGAVDLSSYAKEWIDSNPRITSPRTRERYGSLLRIHIAPTLGQSPLGKIGPSTVRRWHTELIKSASADTAAKAYRLLRAIYNTAVGDELVARNPCKIDGGGVERPQERPIATVAEVEALAEEVGDRWRLLVLLACWTSLRFGELTALTRFDINLMTGTVSVTKNRQRLDDGTSVVREPKSAAGHRKVAIPSPLVPAIKHHLDTYAEPGRDGIVFVGEKGAPIDRSHWNRRWVKARRAIGRDDLRFHDLRHTGNTIAAATGASTAELMRRMGHSSVSAAIRYQHATDDRDQAIADALGKVMTQADVRPIRQEEHGEYR